jgi:ADP-heptose:LPS heptosyltransferase
LPETAQRLLLQNHQSPGDVLVMSVAVGALARQHPGKFVVDVEGTAREIFDFNPHVARFNRDDGQPFRTLPAHYPAVHSADNRGVPFAQGYVEWFALQLGVNLVQDRRAPELYLSEEEKGWISQVQEVTGKASKFFLVNAGHKMDFTAKYWSRQNFQEVVDRLRGKILFVQVGEAGHNHPPLEGVLNLVGKTTTRQLIRLAWHAQGALCCSTFLAHIMAAWEKPCVMLLGGREPANWTSYPTQLTMTTLGTLPCCRTKSCWKSRVVPLGDGSEQDGSLCERPTLMKGGEHVGQCMALITPADVERAILRYYDGGVLSLA